MFEEQKVVSSPKRAKKSSKKITIIVVAVVAVLAIGVASYFIYDYVQDQNAKIERLSDPQEAAKDEAAKVTALVAALADVPSDETPTVATVNDASKLQGQAFFVKAQNGDKVLIFTKAKKAYLYRPSTNKIIEVAPVNIGDGQEQTQQ